MIIYLQYIYRDCIKKEISQTKDISILLEYYFSSKCDLNKFSITKKNSPSFIAGRSRYSGDASAHAYIRLHGINLAETRSGPDCDPFQSERWVL